MMTINPPLDASFTNIPTITVSGQVNETPAAVTINGRAATLTGSTFVLENMPLAEGQNSITALATDLAGNKGTAVATVTLDTANPQLFVTAPANGLLTRNPQLTITIIGMVDEPLASLTVNGGAATLNGNTFEYVMTLAAGDNSVLITATDLAGNVATTTVTIQRDSTPPKVVIVAPLSGLLTNNPQIQVSGTVDDAEATLTLLGAPISVANKVFTVGYLLIDGDNSIQVKAVDKAGNEGTSAVTVILDAQAPVVTLSAPYTATAGTDVQITVNATDNRGLTLVDLNADGASLWSAAPTGATASQTVSLRLSPALAPGATVTVRARALDAAANSGSATAVITIDKAADGPGWLQGKALDDSRGLPLEGAQVSVTDAKGIQQTITTPADGAWFFELASGAAKVEVTKSGFTTVRRDVTVRPGQRTSVLDSRLTRIDGMVHTVDATGGVVVGAGLVPAQVLRLAIPANALSTQADVRLTPVSNQGLITPLPLGWSPLAVADLRLIDPITAAPVDPQPLAAPASLTLPLPTGLGDIALTAELTRYDATSRTWLATADVAIAAKATTATAQITQPGQYALVLADPTPLNPPAPIAGQELAAATLSATDFSLVTTTGRVVPQAAPPSVGLRAAGDLLLVARPDAATTPALISGLIVNARVTEKFDLTSGSTLQPAATVQDIVLYRTACATSIAGGATEPPFDSAQGSALRTTFPVSPSRDFTIVDLLLGKITVDITQPDTSGGVMVGTDGARLLQPDGTALSIPTGALTGSVPVTVATLPEAAVSSLVGADFRLLRGVDIAITGQTLKSSATLSIPAPAGFDPALPVVVAKKFDVKGGSKLKLVAAAKLSGSIINSEPLTPELTSSTNSINSSGQYLFLQATAPIGYVAGQITDAAAAAFAGIQVTAQLATLADLTGIDGHYLLALAAGSQVVTALDPTRGDAASGTVAIAANSKSTLNLAVRMVPPTVTSITPANGAINVQPDVPVVVTFSKPMDKTTVTAPTLKLTNSTNSLNSTTTWNAEATVATIYPAEAFTQEKTYNVTISATVKDVQGYSLGQDVVSIFSVRRTTAPAMPAAGAISGTFPDADGFITVTGTQGSAAADNTVLLINDTTGEIQSVTPASNGSFSGKIRGQLGDEIKVVLMDYSGNQTTISYLTFKGPDGSYLVTAKGGKIEGEGGSLLDIPAGALAGSAVIKVTALPEANLPIPLQAPGTFLSAFNIDAGETSFQKEVHLSIPVPVGFDPKTPVFVTRPSEFTNADGSVEKVYEIIDSTKIVNGRITTASPPFDGITGIGSYIFTAFPEINVGIVSGYTYQDMDEMPGYQPAPAGVSNTPTVTYDADGNPIYTYAYDRPIQGAVIRTPAAWNYVSYSNSRGGYAGFTTLFVVPGAPDVQYQVTAIHPLTMLRKSITGYLSGSSNLITNLNFKLADKTTIQPDKTNPTIDISFKATSGQPPENRISSGLMPLGTELAIALFITDQSPIIPIMTVVFQSLDMASSISSSVTLTLLGKTLVSAQTSDKPAIWRYNYQPTFSTDLKGSPPFNFKPQKPGLYQITVDATDISLNKAPSKIIFVRVVAPGTIPGGVDGPPRVDSISPNNGVKDISVGTPVTAWFSEPVDNVTDSTFKLIDSTTGLQVPASINTSFEGGRMQAVLTPQGNLTFDRSYQVVLTVDIVDVNTNPSVGNVTLPLVQEFQSIFTTKSPSAFDLSAADQFSGGHDIGFYFDVNKDASYTYVSSGDKGWRVIDVSDPTNPEVVHTTSSSCVAGGIPACTNISSVFNYRGVAVHPDPNMALLAITENIVFPDNNQYGYIRFYDLAADPSNPPRVGQEKLAEAFSGIPGRVALSGDYAYVATAAAALQVVSISTAINNVKNGLPTNEGSSIVGVFDSIGQNFGSPNDIAVYGSGKALLTTNPGYLLVLDINNPFPVLMGLLEPAKVRASRVAGTSDFEYSDSNGNLQKMDLAVVGGNGRIRTINLTDPYNPGILATVKDANGKEVVSYPYDISLNSEEGLAIVSTLSEIQMIDIKDPNNPRLLNIITQLPDTSGAITSSGTPAMLPIGTIPAIVENKGWLYMADQNKGMRTMGVNANDIIVYNESNIQVPEIGYSIGLESERIYSIVVKFEDPEIDCSNDDLEGKMVIKTRSGGAVNPLTGIDHPTNYSLSFRKGSDDKCYADLKNSVSSSVYKRFIATNFPSNELAPTIIDGSALAPVFGSIGTKAVFEFSNRNNGKLLRRRNVPLEDLLRIAFDGNRDGKIDFRDPEDQNYTFWVNENPVTSNLSDLENFAPLKVQLSDHARQVIKRLQNPASAIPKITFHLQFKNTNGTNPSVNLFESVGTGMMQYLKDQHTAEEQLKITKENWKVITVSTIEKQLPLNTLKDDNFTGFIIEGKSAGAGNLTITMESDGVFIADSFAKLKLMPIKLFYDKYTTEFNTSTNKVNTTISNLQMASFTPKTDEYVLYVHGWNMEEESKEGYAQNMFKRLWWQGYSGKLGLYSWPTLIGLLTFDESEVRAWNSSEALKNLLLSDMKKYWGKIRIIGHSMGGIVSGETINKLPGPGVVATYIATQTALSAHLYDNSVTEKSLALKVKENPMLMATSPAISALSQIMAPNIFGYYSSGGESSSDKPYLSSNVNKATHYNYCNVNDYALSRGELGLFGAWELNNLVRTVKPPYSYDPLFGLYLKGLSQLTLPDDRYEIFGNIVKSRSKALGATTQPVYGFIQKNLNKLFGFDKKQVSHSRQFKSTDVMECGYWNEVMNDFGLLTTFKNGDMKCSDIKY